MNGLGTPGAEALAKRLGKSGFRTQGDQLPAVQVAFQGRHRRVRHMLGKGPALVRRNGAVAQRAGVIFQFFDGGEIAFIKKPAADPQGSPDDAGMLGTQLSDLFAQLVVYLHQVSLPVETFKDYPRGAGGQKGRRRLGSGDSTPDDHIHLTATLPQQSLWRWSRGRRWCRR